MTNSFVFIYINIKSFQISWLYLRPMDIMAMVLRLPPPSQSQSAPLPPLFFRCNNFLCDWILCYGTKFHVCPQNNKFGIKGRQTKYQNLMLVCFFVLDISDGSIKNNADCISYICAIVYSFGHHWHRTYFKWWDMLQNDRRDISLFIYT